MAANVTSGQHRGWRWDFADDRLEVVVNGTEVAAFNSDGIALSGRGTVTQQTNRTTGVTLNNRTGTITTDNASLAAEGTAEFVVTNSLVAANDIVVVCEQSGADGGGTIVFVSGVAAGSFNISVHNGNVAVGTAETGAILVNFAVIQSAT